PAPRAGSTEPAGPGGRVRPHGPGAPGGAPCPGGFAHRYAPTTHHGVRRAAAPAERVCPQGRGHAWPPTFLSSDPPLPLPPPTLNLSSQDAPCPQALRPAHLAAHEIRTGHQSQDGPSAWDHDAPDGAVPGRRGDPVSRSQMHTMQVIPPPYNFR